MPNAEFSKIARGVRRLRREGRQPGRRAGRAGALRQGGARRPRGAAARAGDEAVDGALLGRHAEEPAKRRRPEAWAGPCFETRDAALGRLARHEAGHDVEREPMPSVSCVGSRPCRARACGMPASRQPAYPTRNVEIIVSYGPGGSTDIVARIVAQKLQERLGQIVRGAQPAGRQRHASASPRRCAPRPTATRSTTATPPRPWWCRRSPRPTNIRSATTSSRSRSPASCRWC